MYNMLGFVFPTLMTLAAACDLLTMKIPNWVTAALAAAFLPIALVVGLSWSEIVLHVSAGLLLLVLGVGMFAARWMGGGDAKLLAGIALWLGFGSPLINFLLLTAVFGGLLAVALLLMRRVPLLPQFTVSWSWLQRLHNGSSGIPYGIALAGGALATYPHSTIAKFLVALAN